MIQIFTAKDLLLNKNRRNFMVKKPRLPSVAILLCILALFVVIMFGSIVILELPIQLALLAVWFMILGFGLYLGNSYLKIDRKSTRLNSSHVSISYAVFRLHTKTSD